eukprot:jgi/Mesen1/6118/ME000311S05214
MADPPSLLKVSLKGDGDVAGWSWSVSVDGHDGSLDYRVTLADELGRDLPMWHSVPLFASPALLNCICKTPQGSSASYEVACSELSTPLRLSRDEDRVVSYARPPAWNIGLLPQTWENSGIDNNVEQGGVTYDGKPLEAIDVSSRARHSGEVYEVKIVTAVAVISYSQLLSWKLIVISHEDPKAQSIADSSSLEQHMPGAMAAIREWLCRGSSPTTSDERTTLRMHEEGALLDVVGSVLRHAHSHWQLIFPHHHHSEQGSQSLYPDPRRASLQTSHQASHQASHQTSQQASHQASHRASDRASHLASDRASHQACHQNSHRASHQAPLRASQQASSSGKASLDEQPASPGSGLRLVGPAARENEAKAGEEEQDLHADPHLEPDPQSKQELVPVQEQEQETATEPGPEQEQEERVGEGEWVEERVGEREREPERDPQQEQEQEQEEAGRGRGGRRKARQSQRPTAPLGELSSSSSSATEPSREPPRPADAAAAAAAPAPSPTARAQAKPGDREDRLPAAVARWFKSTAFYETLLHHRRSKSLSLPLLPHRAPPPPPAAAPHSGSKMWSMGSGEAAAAVSSRAFDPFDPFGSTFYTGSWSPEVKHAGGGGGGGTRARARSWQEGVRGFASAPATPGVVSGASLDPAHSVETETSTPGGSTGSRKARSTLAGEEWLVGAAPRAPRSGSACGGSWVASIYGFKHDTWQPGRRSSCWGGSETDSGDRCDAGAGAGASGSDLESSNGERGAEKARVQTLVHWQSMLHSLLLQEEEQQRGQEQDREQEQEEGHGRSMPGAGCSALQYPEAQQQQEEEEKEEGHVRGRDEQEAANASLGREGGAQAAQLASSQWSGARALRMKPPAPPPLVIPSLAPSPTSPAPTGAMWTPGARAAAAAMEGTSWHVSLPEEAQVAVPDCPEAIAALAACHITAQVVSRPPLSSCSSFATASCPESNASSPPCSLRQQQQQRESIPLPVMPARVPMEADDANCQRQVAAAGSQGHSWRCRTGQVSPGGRPGSPAACGESRFDRGPAAASASAAAGGGDGRGGDEEGDWDGSVWEVSSSAGMEPRRRASLRAAGLAEEAEGAEGGEGLQMKKQVRFSNVVQVICLAQEAQEWEEEEEENENETKKQHGGAKWPRNAGVPGQQCAPAAAGSRGGGHASWRNFRGPGPLQYALPIVAQVPLDALGQIRPGPRLRSPKLPLGATEEGLLLPLACVLAQSKRRPAGDVPNTWADDNRWPHLDDSWRKQQGPEEKLARAQAQA